MDRIRFNRLETLVQDLIDDVFSGYSQEMYDEDMRNLEEFIEQELDRAREEGKSFVLSNIDYYFEDNPNEYDEKLWKKLWKVAMYGKSKLTTK